MSLAPRIRRLERLPRFRPRPSAPRWPPEAILDTPEMIETAVALRDCLRRDERPAAELVERLRRLRAAHEAALDARHGVTPCA